MPRLTVGLSNRSANVDDEQVKRVAAALDVQVKRDLAPIWGVDADVVALGADPTIPRGVSPIIIVDQTPNDFAGVHTITQNVPWAMVSTKRDWALAASHECVELLVDPSGQATRSGIGLILQDGALQDGPERVDYLLEVCDPIEDSDHAYPINDVRVSDFYTPDFFADVPAPGVRYSFNGALTRPRSIGPNGYLSWHDPATRELRQLRRFGAYSIVDLPTRNPTDANTRNFVDRNTPTPRTHPELFTGDEAATKLPR